MMSPMESRQQPITSKPQEILAMVAGAKSSISFISKLFVPGSDDVAKYA